MNMFNHSLGGGSGGLEREQLLELLLAELDGMVYRCRNDEHWTMEFVSKGCLPLTGYRPEELLGNACRSYESIMHPADREHVRATVDFFLAAYRPKSKLGKNI